MIRPPKFFGLLPKIAPTPTLGHSPPNHAGTTTFFAEMSTHFGCTPNL